MTTVWRLMSPAMCHYPPSIVHIEHSYTTHFHVALLYSEHLLKLWLYMKTLVSLTPTENSSEKSSTVQQQQVHYVVQRIINIAIPSRVSGGLVYLSPTPTTLTAAISTW